MSKWNIYHKDGSILTDVDNEQIVVHGLEYTDSWMGECYVTINFENNAPIKFQIGDYIIYRGERFELNYDPGKVKDASKNTYGEAFKYDSVKFTALQDELTRTEFLDVVLNDNELHYTALPKFSFYVETLDDLLDRIQANLDEQIGNGLWKIFSRNMERSSQRGCTEADWNTAYGGGTSDITIDSKSITIDTKTCWEALALVNSEWDVNFVIRGRNIYVGTAGIPTANIFKYGLGNGLYEVDQNADSDQSIITRLRAYGSEKNLPSHYYADLGIKYKANITKVLNVSTFVEFLIDLDYIETYFKTPREYNSGSGNTTYGNVLKVTFDYKTIITGYVTKDSNTGKCRFYSEVKNSSYDTGDEPSKDNLDAFITQVKEGNTLLYISSGINSKNIPYENKEYAKNLPNNMAINRLMLPGFPHVSLKDYYNSLSETEKKYVNPSGREHIFSEDKYRPYIDSINIEEIGLRSASQFFDTDDKTNGIIEIYPTIEEMEIGGVRIDEINEGVAPDDDGRFNDGQTVPNIDIYLSPSIDFDINDLKDDDFAISMKDGMCGGRTFNVAASNKVNGRWRLTIERVPDDALDLYFPYKDYPIRKGDHFVLTGIKLPDSYVMAASLKLLKYAIALLDKNDYTRYVYQPKVDEIFMARQHDTAMDDKTGTIKSLHDTLKAGDIMQFEEDDFGIDAQITIDQLTIKEEDGKIPTYEITLREDKEVGTIQKIQQQISSISNGNFSGGLGGETTNQITETTLAKAKKYFLSKLTDDTAQGLITFIKGLISQTDIKVLGNTLFGNNGAYIDHLGDAVLNSLRSLDYANAAEQGFSIEKEASGKYHAFITNLTVWGKAIFHELEIRKLSYAGGNIYLSGAGSKLVKVVPVKWNADTSSWEESTEADCEGWKCYLLADDGTTATMNYWREGDQVRCQTMGQITSGGTYEDVSNKSYWRTIPDNGVSTVNEKIYGTKTETYLDDEGNEQTCEVQVELYDGQAFAWIVIGKHGTIDGYDEEGSGYSSTDYSDTSKHPAPLETCDIPAEGDTIVLDGNRKRGDDGGYAYEDRQNVIMMETTGDDAPRIVGYYHVTEYKHTYTNDDGDEVPLYVFLLSAKEGVKFNSSSFEWISADGSVINMINYRGDWSKDSTYSKNDQVNYDNAVWVCIANSGDKVKGEEPSDTSTVWKKVLEGGKGEDAYQYILTCNPTVLHLDKDGNFASNALSSDSSKATIGAFLYVSKGGKAVSIKDGDITWYLSRNGSAEGYNGSDNECTFNISNTDKDIAIIAVYDGLQVAQQSIPIVKDGEDGAPAEAYSISLIKETRTIGSVSGQPVIAVHFYWQKGDKSTSTGRITELGDNAFVRCYVDGEYNSSMTNRINGGNDYFDYAAYESIWNGKSTISIALYIGSDNLVASANFSLGQSGEGVVMAYKNSDTQPAKPNVTDLANLASLGWSRKPQKGGSYEKVTDISYGSYSNGNNSTSDSTAKSWTSLSDGSNTWMKSPSGLSDSYGWAIMKVTFRTNADNVNVYAVIKAYSETNFDYIQLHALDTEITGSSSLRKNGVSYVSGNGIEQSYTYNVANAGEHFFYVSYCKDSSGNSYGDYGLFRFDLSANQASTPSTVWMSQATLKDGKAVLPWSDAVQITGEDGKDAYRVVISPSTLVLDTDDTGNVTTFPTDKTASISIYKGSDDVTSSFWKNDIYPSNYSNCNGRIANLNSKPYNVYVTAIDSDKYTDPTTGKDTNVSKTNGFLEFYLTNGTDTVIAHVNVQVNMAKYMGSVQWNNEQWSSKYAELSNSLSGKLADFKTEVEQNARQWSVEASQKAAGRRNLLVGSAFRKQNDGTYKLSVGTCSIEKNTGIDGVNCAHSVNTYNGSSQSYNGVFWDGSQTGTSAQSIKIERGKKYTISCWVKCDRTDVLISLESIYTDKQTGATRKTKPKTTTNRFYVSKANVWELFSCVIDTSLNGDGTQNTQYDYVAVNIWCVHTLTDESGKGITVNAYFCKPMLEEGDTYNGWTLSEQDYDYVGGNLLDNTNTLVVGDNLKSNAILSKDDEGVAVSTRSVASSVASILSFNLALKANTDYVLSYYIKSISGGADKVAHTLNLGDNIQFAEYENGGTSQNTSSAGHTPYSGYIDRRPISSQWTRVWYHFRLISDTDSQNIAMRIYGYDGAGSISIKKPKLEEGATMTEWTERKTDLIDKASLKAAGILVDANAVTLYGNQIHIKSKKDSGDDAFLIDTDTGKVTAGLIDADTIVAKGIKTQALEAQNLNVTGNSQLGIFKIKTSEGDKRDNYTISGDMITYSGSYKLPDGKTNVVSNDGLAYLMYKPLFIRQGASDIGKYMRLGNCYTEWDDCGNGDGDSYLFHGAAARYVCSSSSGTCEMYALPQTLGYNTNYKPVSYIYSTKVSQDDPALAIYVQSKGTSGERTAIQTNAAIRGVFASNAKSISYSQTISTGVGLVICTNPSEMTLTLPPNPIEGQTLIIIQGSTAKVWIDPNGKTIYCGGVTKTSSNKFCSNTVGQFNIFIYVNGYWQLQFINNKA